MLQVLLKESAYLAISLYGVMCLIATVASLLLPFETKGREMKVRETGCPSVVVGGGVLGGGGGGGKRELIWLKLVLDLGWVGGVCRKTCWQQGGKASLHV